MTRIKIQKDDVIRSYIATDWDYVYNYDQHFLGIIWVCWNKDEFEVNVLYNSYQCIKLILFHLFLFRRVI
jgi:hypothetical protein